MSSRKKMEARADALERGVHKGLNLFSLRRPAKSAVIIREYT